MNTFLLSAALVLLPACGNSVVSIGDVKFVEQCIDVASGEVALAFADVDRDGFLDLIVAAQSAGEVIVLRGDGQGSFGTPTRFAAGSNPTDLVAADINDDGLTDLVIANHETSYLTLLIGDGHGAFVPPSNSPFTVDVHPHPHAVAIEDLDNDGSVDLVVDDRNGNALLVFRGMGSGRFDPASSRVPVGGDPYRGFAIADLNADGRLDIVTPNPTNVGIAISNDGESPSFQMQMPLQASSPFAVAVTDLNGDAHPDIVSASENGSANVNLFLGDGKGAFKESSASPFRMAAGAKDIATGDINGDGFDDVVVTSWSSDVLVLWGGAENVSISRLTGIDNPWGVAVADINGDGKSDIAIAEGDKATVHIYTSR